MAGLSRYLRRVGGSVVFLAVLGSGLLFAPAAGAAEDSIRVGPGVYLSDLQSVDGSDARSVTWEPRSSSRVRSSAPLRPRIVGGTPIDISQAPWQTAVTLNPAVFVGNAFERQFCGGSLVAPTLVISAAHCLFDPNTGAPTPAGDIAAVTGRTQLSSSQGQEIALKDAYIFRDGQGNLLYDPRTSAWDISVLELSQPSTAGTIKLAGLDERELWANGRTVQVSGWGTTSFGGPPSDFLLAAELGILPDIHCARSLPMDPTTSQCAGVISGKRDACQGDSGGPLVAPTLDGSARLVGNVQAGFECGRSQNPGLYGRFGTDPVQTALRNTGLEKAGVDIVGSGARPPTTLTPNQALELALVLSEDQCEKDRACRQFNARKCKPRGAGFQCLIENFAKTRKLGKFTCERKALFTADTGRIVRKLLGKWECFRGW